MAALIVALWKASVCARAAEQRLTHHLPCLGGTRKSCGYGET